MGKSCLHHSGRKEQVSSCSSEGFLYFRKGLRQHSSTGRTLLASQPGSRSICTALHGFLVREQTKGTNGSGVSRRKSLRQKKISLSLSSVTKPPDPGVREAPGCSVVSHISQHREMVQKYEVSVISVIALSLLSPHDEQRWLSDGSSDSSRQKRHLWFILAVQDPPAGPFLALRGEAWCIAQGVYLEYLHLC